MSHFNARKPVSYYDNFPKGLLKRKLGLPSSRSTRSNINYARRHHIILETDFPMSVSECAIPKGMGMSLADLQNNASMLGFPISDKYGKLSRLELCRLYKAPFSVSTVSTNMASKMSPVSPNAVAKEIVAQARAAADDTHEAAKEAAVVAAENPSDTAAQSAAIAAQQVATVAEKALDTVVALVENKSTAAAELVVDKIEKLADVSTDLVKASVQEGEAHQDASSPQAIVKAEEATLNVVEKEEKAQEALNNLTEAVIEVEETGVSEFALQIQNQMKKLKKVSDVAQPKLQNATQATLEVAKEEENKVKDAPVSAFTLEIQKRAEEKLKKFKMVERDIINKEAVLNDEQSKLLDKAKEYNERKSKKMVTNSDVSEDEWKGRRKGKSRNRSKCKDKRKYFPKTKMSCKKRRMTWNRKSKRCNIKNM